METGMNWPEAFTAVGVVWAVAFVIWRFFKDLFSKGLDE